MEKSCKFYLNSQSNHKDSFFIAHRRRTSSRILALCICKWPCKSLSVNNSTNTFKLDRLRSLDSLIVSMVWVPFSSAWLEWLRLQQSRQWIYCARILFLCTSNYCKRNYLFRNVSTEPSIKGVPLGWLGLSLWPSRYSQMSSTRICILKLRGPPFQKQKIFFLSHKK
jgi:hypothetical protein